MSVISQSPFRLRANTRKVTKEFRGLRQPTPWWHYPNSSRTSSSPPKLATFTIFPPAFHHFCARERIRPGPSACCALGKGEHPSAAVFDLNSQISQRPGAIGRRGGAREDLSQELA